MMQMLAVLAARLDLASKSHAVYGCEYNLSIKYTTHSLGSSGRKKQLGLWKKFVDTLNSVYPSQAKP